MLGDRIRKYPEARCSSTKECIENVKTTGTHVYSAVSKPKYNNINGLENC